VVCYCCCTESIAGPDVARGEGLEDSSSEDDEAGVDDASHQRTGMNRGYRCVVKGLMDLLYNVL